MMRISTMLFVPGHDEGKLLKIPTITAEGFILDLEDAVADSVKSVARVRARETINRYTGPAEVHVRVNSYTSRYLYDDLQSVVVSGLRGIVLPKTSDEHEIRTIDWVLSSLEGQRGLNPGAIEILPLIESVDGLERVDRIASSCKRIRRLGFGAHDFSMDAGLEWPQSKDEISPTLVYAKSELVLASRRNGLEPPHDGAYANFKDSEGLLRETQFSKSLGFFGKHAIHPEQLSIIRQVFRWNTDDVEQAREIVNKFDASVASGIAAIEVNGQMIDYATAERARRLLESV